MIFKKCKGYIQRRQNSSSCIIRQNSRSWHQVLRKVIRSEEEMRISIPLFAYLEVEKDYINDYSSNMRVPKVVIAEIKEAIIQRVIKDENLREELSRISKR